MKLAYCLPLLLTVPLSAATISLSTSCFPGAAQTPNVNPTPYPYSACRSLDSYTGGGATAFSQVYYKGATQAGDWNTLHIVQDVYAIYAHLHDTDLTGAPSSAAQSSLSYHGDYLTSGPVRQGFLQINLSGYSGDPYSGYMNATILLSMPDGSPSANIDCYDGLCHGNSHEFYSGGLIPYVLGTSFSLDGTGNALASAGFNDGSSAGDTNLSYNFRFFEADGVTPVSVSEIPEPASVSLVLVSLAALLWRRRLSA